MYFCCCCGGCFALAVPRQLDSAASRQTITDPSKLRDGPHQRCRIAVHHPYSSGHDGLVQRWCS